MDYLITVRLSVSQAGQSSQIRFSAPHQQQARRAALSQNGDERAQRLDVLHAVAEPDRAANEHLLLSRVMTRRVPAWPASASLEFEDARRALRAVDGRDRSRG